MPNASLNIELLEMEPQQVALNNSYSDLPPIAAVDCICGMSVPEPPILPDDAAATSDAEGVFTIQCDDCGRWLHGSCVGLTPDDLIPDNFSCPRCLENRPSPAATPTPSAVGRPRKPRSHSTSDEYVMANHVASDAASALKLLMLQYEELLDVLPQDSSTLAAFNYEFAGECIVLPDDYDIRQLDKAIDVREIRSRGGQPKKGSVKKGMFVAQSVEPGQAICEFCGHVMRIETLFSRIHRVTTVQQSFVLFPVTKADVILDARKHGSAARWIRRSCRPNTTVKSVLRGNDVHWFVFAKNALKPGDEIFLPLDWDAGNRFFRYECACSAPETCLAPDELLPEGSRESLALHRELQDIVSPLEAHPPVAVTAFAAHDQRKMSREDRKLQRYIEAIEKMESADRKRSRSTPSSSPEAKEVRRPSSPKAIASPPKKAMLRRKSSFSAVPLKKLWAQKIDPKISFTSSPLSSSPATPRQEKKDSEATLLDEENIDVEAMDDDARDVVTPVSQIVEDSQQTQPESATKRLSLSDYLHRRQLSATSESAHVASSPIKEQSEEDMKVPDSAPDFDSAASPDAADKLSELSNGSNISRESGEYIEAPTVHPPTQSSHSPPSSRYPPPSYPSSSGNYYDRSYQHPYHHSSSNGYYNNNNQGGYSQSGGYSSNNQGGYNSNRNRPHHVGGFRGRPNYRPHHYHHNSRGRPYQYGGRRRDYPPPPSGGGGYR